MTLLREIELLYILQTIYLFK